MTEHSAVIFVFFFLAEYASIVLICLLTSVLFLGGYLSFLHLNSLFYIFNYFSQYIEYISFQPIYNFNLSIFLFIPSIILNLDFNISLFIIFLIYININFKFTIKL